MTTPWPTVRCRQCDDAGKAATQPFCDHQEFYVPEPKYSDPECDLHSQSCGLEDFCCLRCPNLRGDDGEE